jgi:hypothetical protein
VTPYKVVDRAIMIRWITIVALTLSWLVLPAAGNADLRRPDCFESMSQMDMPMDMVDSTMADMMEPSSDGSAAADVPCSKGSPCGLMQVNVCAPTCAVQSTPLADLQLRSISLSYGFQEQNLLRGLTVQPSVPPNIMGERIT